MLEEIALQEIHVFNQRNWEILKLELETWEKHLKSSWSLNLGYNFFIFQEKEMVLEAYRINIDNFYSETKYFSTKSFNFKHSARKDKKFYQDCVCQLALQGNAMQKYYYL